MKHFFILLLLMSCLFPQVGSWSTIPLITEVTHLQPYAQDLLIGTNGGILSVNPTSREISGFEPAIGLSNPGVNCIAVDDYSRLWVGGESPGAVVQVIDLLTGSEINLGAFDLDGVQAFQTYGDSMFAVYRDALGGGIMYFRNQPDDVQYLDIFENFPGGSDDLMLSEINGITIAGSRLVFSTPMAIVWAPVKGSNLKDPATWMVAGPPDGTDAFTALSRSGDQILVGVDDEVMRFDFNTFTPVLDASQTGGTIQDIQTLENTSGDYLVISTSRAIMMDADTTRTLASGSDYQTGVFLADQQEVWLTGSTQFLEIHSAGLLETLRPNIPVSGTFLKMDVLPDGSLVAGTRDGFPVLTSEGWWNLIGATVGNTHDRTLWDWQTFHADTIPDFRATTIEDLLIEPDGRLVASIQGRGVLRTRLDFVTSAEFYNTENQILTPTFDSETFVLPGQVAYDSKGNLWMTTKFVRVGDPTVTVMTPDGTHYHVNQSSSGLNNRMIRAIAIDSQDRIWMGAQLYSELQSSGGIYVLDPGSDLSQLNSVPVATIQGTPLEGTDILQLEIDAQDNLWIVTPSGVQSMALPQTWLNSAELQAHARIYMTPVYWELGDYEVTGVEIDRRGNRWFLTADAGVHILQANGAWMNGGFGYHTGNSPILDDQVLSAAFDAEQGLAYLATPKGLSVFNTPFANPRENFSTVFIYPQPFNPEIHENVLIQGLMDNSSVKILTINGRLVKELTSVSGEVQGFEARWDGRDQTGDRVGNGVYLILLFNEDGLASTQKLAILRD